VQTLARVGGTEKRSRGTLEGDVASQPGIFGQIDFAHAPTAQSFHDGVRSDPLADHERSIGRSLARVLDNIERERLTPGIFGSCRSRSKDSACH
jgi:hypothetical protein